MVNLMNSERRTPFFRMPLIKDLIAIYILQFIDEKKKATITDILDSVIANLGLSIMAEPNDIKTVFEAIGWLEEIGIIESTPDHNFVIKDYSRYFDFARSFARNQQVKQINRLFGIFKELAGETKLVKLGE